MPGPVRKKRRRRPGDPVEIIVRAERLGLTATRRPCQLLSRSPEHVLYLGSEIRYIVRLGDHKLVAVEKNRGDGKVPALGDGLYLEWSARDALVAPVHEASS
jgi:hypothetical protein